MSMAWVQILNELPHTICADISGTLIRKDGELAIRRKHLCCINLIRKRCYLCDSSYPSSCKLLSFFKNTLSYTYCHQVEEKITCLMNKKKDRCILLEITSRSEKGFFNFILNHILTYFKNQYPPISDRNLINLNWKWRNWCLKSVKQFHFLSSYKMLQFI